MQQSRELATHAHGVISALLDSSKIAAKRMDSTAAVLFDLQAIHPYSTFLCPIIAIPDTICLDLECLR